MAAEATDLPLAQRLNGLRLPPPVAEGDWPLDAAATLLALAGGVVLAGAVALLAWQWARRRSRAFQALVAQALDEKGEAARLAGLAALLRRVALARPDGTEAAALSGPAWLAWLERRTGAGFFLEGAGQVFGEALYRHPGEVDWQELAQRLPGVLARLQGGRRAVLP